MQRNDGRALTELRKIEIIPNYLDRVHTSVMIKQGNTWVLCVASVDEKVPKWLHGQGTGWVTAEYNMLPGSAGRRKIRDRVRGFVGGRDHEIQRLISRSLRSVMDLASLGERTIWIDCDVLQADGGTRTASINGGFVALYRALSQLKSDGVLNKLPLTNFMGAVSVGVVNGKVLTDLSYGEDSVAEVDLNIAMTSAGEYVEIQGNAESNTFTRAQLDDMLASAQTAINDIISIQMKALGL